MQLVITSGTEEEISVFKSKMFYLYCNKSINTLIEEVPEYPAWIEVANAKLDALDKIDVDVVKVDNITTLSLTRLDGSVETVEIYDGEQGIQGPKGDTGDKGEPGKDGVIQYEAGENITIEGNVISASGGITLDDVKTITGELTDLSTEDKSSLVNAVNEVFNKPTTTLLENKTIDLNNLDIEYGTYIISGSDTVIKYNNNSEKPLTQYSKCVLLLGKNDFCRNLSCIQR